MATYEQVESVGMTVSDARFGLWKGLPIDEPSTIKAAWEGVRLANEERSSSPDGKLLPDNRIPWKILHANAYVLAQRTYSDAVRQACLSLTEAIDA